MKALLNYLLTLLIATLAAALLLFRLIPLILHIYFKGWDNFLISLGTAFTFIFLTYNLYLLVFKVIAKNSYHSFGAKAGFCFVVSVTLSYIIARFVIGSLTAVGVFLSMITIGITSIFMPALDDFFRRKLKLINEEG